MERHFSFSALIILFFLTHCESALGQLSDNAARARARHFTVQLGQPAEFNSNASVTRGNPPSFPYPSTSIRIRVGELKVSLDPEGNLRSYADLGAGRTEPRSGQERFTNEDAAWAYVESKLQAVDAPQGLQRIKIQRRGGDGTGAPNYLMHFEQRPHGYQAQSGNVVICSVHRITGRLLTLHIGRGWTHEPPNIQVTPQAAKVTASRTLGGNTEDWNYELQYWTSPDTTTAPEIREMNQRKVMRLCYNLYSSNGGVIVDSVNGDMVWHGTPGNSHPNSGQNASNGGSEVTADNQNNQESTAKDITEAPESKDANGMGMQLILFGLPTGVLVAFGGYYLWKMKSR